MDDDNVVFRIELRDVMDGEASMDTVENNDRLRGHKFITKELEKELPPLYSQENEKDPTAYVKYFDPNSRWTWFGMEYSKEEEIFFGYVYSGLDPAFDELGYFSLEEVGGVKNKMGLPMERDLYFKPMKLSEIEEEGKAQ